MSRDQDIFVPGALWKRPPPPVIGPLRELTAHEKEVVAERRAAVHALGQDAVDFVGELHKAGLIDGWRSVGDVVLFNGIPSILRQTQDRRSSARTDVNDIEKGESHGNP